MGGSLHRHRGKPPKARGLLAEPSWTDLWLGPKADLAGRSVYVHQWQSGCSTKAGDHVLASHVVALANTPQDPLVFQPDKVSLARELPKPPREAVAEFASNRLISVLSGHLTWRSCQRRRDSGRPPGALQPSWVPTGHWLALLSSPQSRSPAPLFPCVAPL